MSVPANSRFASMLDDVSAVASREITSAGDLEASMRHIYNAFLQTDFHELDQQTLKQNAPYLIRDIANIRFSLRDRIEAWYANGLLTRPTEIALRDAFRIMRYAVDMLGELTIDCHEGSPALRAFTGNEHNTQVHPAYANGGNIRFQSGDILLVRGQAHNSAAIARVGDVDTQFSHTSIVYIDNDGKHWVVEALIEDGSVVNTLEDALDHGNGRAVVYRCKDKALAQRAAKAAYDRIRKSQKGWFRSRHIPYDFSMRLEGRDKLFCAKLIHQAYLDASHGKIKLPLFKTRFDQGSSDFYRAIGVKTEETYAPADIDIDPRFGLVAEWRNYRVTPYLRRQDMVMTKFFEWMETRGYKFKPNWSIRLISIFGKLSSYLSSNVKNMLASVVPKIPRGMPRSTIAAITMLHLTAETVMPSLKELSLQHINQTKLPIHPRELLAQLEEIREQSKEIGYLHPPK